MNLSLKKIGVIFMLPVLFISCPPIIMGRNLRIVSHNIPTITGYKAEPIVIKFSQPLHDFTIAEKNIFAGASYRLPAKLSSGSTARERMAFFEKKLSEDKTELILTKKNGYYDPNGVIHIALGGCVSVSNQALDENIDEITYNFTTNKVFFVKSYENSNSNISGLSWEDAFTNVSDALDKCEIERNQQKQENPGNPENPVEIWVARGDYPPEEMRRSSPIDFNVKIIGGFNGDERLPVGTVDPSLTVLKSKRTLYKEDRFIFDFSGSSCSSSDRVLQNFTLQIACTLEKVTLYNCIITNAFCISPWGGSYDSVIHLNEDSVLKNCTIVKNGFNLPNGGSFSSISSPPRYSAITPLATNSLVENTIVWGNLRSDSPKIYPINYFKKINFNNCAIAGDFLGENGTFNNCLSLDFTNTSANGPNFYDPDANNFKLQSNSICIAKGSDGMNIGAFTGE